MKPNQLDRGTTRRLMYVEAKSGDIDGAAARIGWVTFSRSGRSIRCRGLEVFRIRGGGVAGNHFDVGSGAEFRVYGVKSTGSNVHPRERGVVVAVDPDAEAALAALRLQPRD